MSTEIVDTTEGEAKRAEDFRDHDIKETQVSQEINITGLDYLFCVLLFLGTLYILHMWCCDVNI